MENKDIVSLFIAFVALAVSIFNTIRTTKVSKTVNQQRYDGLKSQLIQKVDSILTTLYTLQSSCDDAIFQAKLKLPTLKQYQVDVKGFIKILEDDAEILVADIKEYEKLRNLIETLYNNYKASTLRITELNDKLGIVSTWYSDQINKNVLFKSHIVRAKSVVKYAK